MTYEEFRDRLRDTLKAGGHRVTKASLATGHSKSWVGEILKGKKGLEVEAYLLLCETLHLHPARVFEDRDPETQCLLSLWDRLPRDGRKYALAMMGTTAELHPPSETQVG